MYIKNITVSNYKGFNQLQETFWEPGFNVLVGKNNSGKSTLIDAAELAFTHIPHRSIQTRPDPGIPLTAPSVVDVVFSVSKEELHTYLRRLGNIQVQIPCPPIGSNIMQRLGVTAVNNSSLQRAADWILNQERNTFHLRRIAQPGQGANWVVHRSPSLGVLEAQEGNVNFALGMFQGDGTFKVQTTSSTTQPAGDFGLQLAELFRADIYRFSAERFSLGRSQIGTNRMLAKNAGNLPEVLNNLNSTPARLEEFKARARDILPDIKVFTTQVVSQQNVEIMAWIADPTTGRDDLAISLENCGTGTAQVLALLYAAIVLPRPSVLLIDEPQSFLHPGATRKLLHALRSYSQHQYILATHSPTVISATNPSTITVARLENGETKLDRLSAPENSAQQTCLAELGARLSDVFGADQILWVEGPTEHECFPLILQNARKEPPAGVEIVPLRSTGELQGRNAEVVVDIYNRISRGHSLIPPAVAIVFDRECLDEQARKELGTRSGGLARFLSRRMFENYLLHPEAIAEVTSALRDFRPGGVETADVQKLMDLEKAKPTYYCSPDDLDPAKDWRVNIHGAELLDTIFKNLSENRYEYHKIEHGVLLTKTIIRIDPAFFDEITRFLNGLF